jgi:hypothetical protein
VRDVLEKVERWRTAYGVGYARTTPSA